MRIAQLTKDDGKRVGIPRDGALVLATFLPDKDKSAGDHPAAKSTIRFSLGFQHASYFVRDTYRQLLNLFPLSRGGRPWAQFTDLSGQDLAIPSGSIVTFEELDKGFRVMVDLEGQPMVLDLDATLQEILAHTDGADSPANDAAPEPMVEAEAPQPKPAPSRKAGRGK